MILVDSLGADFPTFQQFQRMLRDYEQSVKRGTSIDSLWQIEAAQNMSYKQQVAANAGYAAMNQRGLSGLNAMYCQQMDAFRQAFQAQEDAISEQEGHRHG